MELMSLQTVPKNRPPMNTSQLFSGMYNELVFMVENAYVEKMLSFLAENKSKIDKNYAFEDGSTILMKCVLGSQKVDINKDNALDSIKKYEQCVKQLVDFGFPIDTQDKYGHTVLHWAVMIQNPYMLRWLIKLGADTTIQDEEGQTVLHLAIRIGFSGGISVLVENAPRELLEMTSRVSGATPLIYATQLGNRDLVLQLLNAGCNPNAQESNKYLRGALHYAFFFDHDEIFDLLLQRGADINVSDYKKKGMLQRAAAHTDGRYLQSIVQNSAKSGSELSDQENLKKILSECGINGMTPMMAAAGAESGDNVERLCQIVKEQATALDHSNRCALHYCSRNRELRCITLLFEVAPEMLETRDENGVTPLMQAVLDGNVDVARFLLQQGANILVKDNELHTVAHSATVSGSPEIVDLISFYNADLSQPDVHQTYPLHYAVRLSTEAGTVEQRRDAHKIINKLIAKGVAVNCEDDAQRQPLFWAASAGDERTCIILTNAGADANAANKDGITALHCAASKGYAKLIELFVNECAALVDSNDKWGCTPLFYAINNQHLSCAQLLIKYGADVNHRDGKGRTPAHCACSAAFFDGVSLLRENGADFTAKNFKSELPIHEATRCGHRDLVDHLLELGLSEPNSKLRNGKTPLHQAVEQHDRDLIERLLKQGANVNAVFYDVSVKPNHTKSSEPASDKKDSKKMHDTNSQKTTNALDPSTLLHTYDATLRLEDVGRTPLDIAVRDGYKTIIELLRSYGGTTASKVIKANVRTIQKYFREYQDYNKMLRQQELARIAAEKELKQLEEERRLREEQERRRHEQEYAAEVERRRAERAKYEFSLSDVPKAPEDHQLDSSDLKLLVHAQQYERKFADQVSRAQQEKKREVEALVSRNDRRTKSKDSFDGDKPPSVLPLPARGSSNVVKLSTAGADDTARKDESLSNDSDSSETPKARADGRSPNPPPGWFVNSESNPKKENDTVEKLAPASTPHKTKRTKEIRDSVNRFDMTRRTTAAMQTLKRAQLRNISEDKIVEQFAKDFADVQLPAQTQSHQNARKLTNEKEPAASLNRSDSTLDSSLYSDYSSRSSSYDYSYSQTDTRSSYTRSSSDTKSRQEPQGAAQKSETQVALSRQPTELRSVKEWETFLNGQIHQLEKTAAPERLNKTAPAVMKDTGAPSKPTDLSRSKSSYAAQRDKELQEKKQVVKKLKETVKDTKLLFQDLNDDADEFLEKVARRNKEEETRIKETLMKKKREDLLQARQNDDQKHGPRATLDTSEPQSSKLLQKRPTGPPKSVLKHSDTPRTEEKSSRSSMPHVNRRGSIVSARSDDQPSARSDYDSSELAEKIGPTGPDDKNWIRTYDGRYRKRHRLVLDIPPAYLELQNQAADEHRAPRTTIPAN